MACFHRPAIEESRHRPMEECPESPQAGRGRVDQGSAWQRTDRLSLARLAGWSSGGAGASSRVVIRPFHRSLRQTSGRATGVVLRPWPYAEQTLSLASKRVAHSSPSLVSCLLSGATGDGCWPTRSTARLVVSFDRIPSLTNASPCFTVSAHLQAYVHIHHCYVTYGRPPRSH